MLSVSKQKRKIDVPIEATKRLQPQLASNNFVNSTTPTVQGSNQVVQSFNFRVQQPTSIEDPTLCWTYQIPQLRTNQRSLTLLTQGFQTVITNYVGDDFPQTISFAFRNFNGYMDKNGSITKKFLVLDLVGTSIKTSAGLTSRDLIYKSQMYNLWDLGQLRTLQMEVYTDEDTTPINFPIATPIQVCFKIIHNVM